MFVLSTAVLPPDDAQLLHLFSGDTRGHGPVLMIFGLTHCIIILMSYSCHRGTHKNFILLYGCIARRAVWFQKLSEHKYTQNERRCQILTFSVKFKAAVRTETGVSFTVAYCCHLTVTYVTRPLCSVETNSLIKPRRFAVIIPNAAKVNRSILATLTHVRRTQSHSITARYSEMCSQTGG
jgi:hypothetical protein